MEQPTVILITETWLNISHPDCLVDIPNYSLYRNDRLNQRGGGVCIYLLNSVIKDTCVEVLDFSISGIETIWLKIRTNAITITLGNIYRPGSASTEATTDLCNVLKIISETHKNVIVFGDFNFPDIKWPLHSISDTNSNCENILTNMIANTNLEQLVTKPTRYRIGQVPSTLDLIITSDPSLFNDIKYLPPIGCSDHVTLSTCIQIILTKKIMSKLNIWKANFSEISTDISKHLSSNVPSRDIQDKWISLSQQIHNSIQIHAPVSHTSSFHKKWFNRDHFALRCHKIRLWKLYRRTGSLEYLTKHRRVANKLTCELRKARSTFETQLTNFGQKAFFNYVSSCLKSKINVPVLKNERGQLCQDHSEVAELFADTFSRAYTAESAGILPTLDPASRVSESISTVEITSEIVRNELNCLKESATPGPDGIPPVI